MLRMSFLEHLEELRKRLIMALAGLGIAFFASLTFSEQLWKIVQEPAAVALASLGYKDTSLVLTSPMESFSIIWVKLPMLTSLFLASPWLLYQVWSFVAPGLYKRERRFAAPFIISAAGLFISGGLFAYFVAFRFGLTFLLGIGQNVNVAADDHDHRLFRHIRQRHLGHRSSFRTSCSDLLPHPVAYRFPRFLLSHSRYAVLGIVILAAIITPTPDVVNLMLFSVPMVAAVFHWDFRGLLART